MDEKTTRIIRELLDKAAAGAGLTEHEKEKCMEYLGGMCDEGQIACFNDYIRHPDSLRSFVR